MYYRPFDRSMDLWIINEFLKLDKMVTKWLLKYKVFMTEFFSFAYSNPHIVIVWYKSWKK